VIFGALPLAEAEGATLAHAVRLEAGEGAGVLRKGHCLTRADLERLQASGIDHVIAARFEAGDIPEDAAALRLAQAIAGPNVRVEAPTTGRSNLFAEAAGLLVVDRDRIDALNRIDPGVTVATLPQYAPVEAGRMVATAKIIPFAVPSSALDAVDALAADGAPLVRVAPYRARAVGVVSTLLPSLKPSVVDKTLAVLAERLAPSGSSIIAEIRVPHQAPAVAQAIADLRDRGAELIIVFGASAVVDPRDVVPDGLRLAGGTVDHLGMPVDPGNLLLIGRVDTVPVIGAPGCARSPKENGFDWVLARLLADVPVTPADIMGMGVGGLLMEIVSRPSPRAGTAEAAVPPARHVAALVLAAGRSTRMGGPNKLLATIDGKPLVRHVVEAARASSVASVTVVTGHMGEAVAAAVADLDVRFVANPAYADGLSTSLRAGLAALPAEAEAVIVLLADMPRIGAAMVDALVAAYQPATGSLIVVPTFEGRRGNPVLWSRRYFADLMAIQGDTGARHLIGENPEAVTEVELGPAVALDLDTPEALAAAGGRLPEDPTA
jgi:molybdenum cofactor cytidylyltransferase